MWTVDGVRGVDYMCVWYENGEELRMYSNV